MDSKQIIERLNALGLTNYRIAQRTGLSQGALSKIVNGKRGKGSLTTFTKLKTYLDSIPCTSNESE